LATALKSNDEIDMKLADGIKDLLERYGLTRTKIIGYSADELSSILNVDEYVAILILNAAKSSTLVV
jgi:hypothetical protein